MPTQKSRERRMPEEVRLIQYIRGDSLSADRTGTGIILYKSILNTGIDLVALDLPKMIDDVCRLIVQMQGYEDKSVLLIEGFLIYNHK